MVSASAAAGPSSFRAPTILATSAGVTPVDGIDVDGDDLFGRVVGDALDVHAALGRDDEGDAAHGAVDEQRAVELAGDVGAGFDVEAVDGLAALAGLLGDEGLAQHLGGIGDDVGDGFDDADAALGIGAEFLEPALAAATGVDLRFDHVDRAGEGFCGGFRLVRLEDGDALADGEAVFAENGFGLVLVDVHVLAFARPSTRVSREGGLSHDVYRGRPRISLRTSS